MLKIHHLQKRYTAPDQSTIPVIHIDDFHLAAAEHLALVGSSGSGKTTLLHLISGILTPDSGTIEFEIAGQKTDITKLGEAERDVFRGRHIGCIFQTHHLMPGFSALENVLLGMTFTGRAADKPWAKHLLDEVGLGDRFHFKPQSLSVGQQQRVACARALASRPALVIADEPTGALDAANAQQVLTLIRNLCTEVRASLLLVSHDAAITKQFPRVVELSALNQPAAGRA